jgi:hypothetical protein
MYLIENLFEFRQIRPLNRVERSAIVFWSAASVRAQLPGMDIICWWQTLLSLSSVVFAQATAKKE